MSQMSQVMYIVPQSSLYKVLAVLGIFGRPSLPHSWQDQPEYGQVS